MRRAAAAAAALLALVLAPQAAATPYEWIEGNDVVAAPDGRNVYAAGAATLSFRADPDSGALTLIGHTETGAMRPQMEISPDGRFVYVARGDSFAGGAIYVFARDAESGLLTHSDTYGGGVPSGSPAPGDVYDLEMSPDGRQLYSVERKPARVAVYERDTETGALTQRQARHPQGDDYPDYYGPSVAAAPDGRHVYVSTGYFLEVHSRDAATGELDRVAVHSRAAGGDTAVAPDGTRVYNGATDVHSYARGADGGLQYLGRTDYAPGGCGPCDAGTVVSAAPDGRSVFSASASDAALIEWTPSAGGLTQERRYVDGQNGVAGMVHPNAMAWSADGRFAYVASAEYVGRGGTYYSSVGDRGSVAAFRRTPGGLEPVGAVGPAFDVETPLPHPYRPGAVTINDGALYTNDPRVRVTVTNQRWTSGLRLSNSADFAAARPLRIGAPEQTYEWTLADSGPEPSVRRVHVRFTPIGDEDVRVFDDIVLDQRRPELVSARIEGRRLRLSALDDRSGVARLEFAATGGKPAKARRFSKRVAVSRATRVLRVRVVDGAGNRSKWKTARRR